MPSSVTSPAVTVTVRLFARYAEVVGRERVDISLPPGATVGDLVTTLSAREEGFSNLIVAEEYTTDGLIKEIRKNQEKNYGAA